MATFQKRRWYIVGERKKVRFNFWVKRELLNYIRAKARSRDVAICEYLEELIIFDRVGCIDKNKLKRKISAYFRTS